MKISQVHFTVVQNHRKPKVVQLPAIGSVFDFMVNYRITKRHYAPAKVAITLQEEGSRAEFGVTYREALHMIRQHYEEKK
jgi:hypothetical protein